MKDHLAARRAPREPSGMMTAGGELWRHAIWAALDGNVEDLAQKLREGIASREEMTFAANLIEGKVKTRRPRLGQPTRLMNEQIAQAFFQFRVAYPGWQKKKIVGKIVEQFGLKGKHGRHVYAVLKALDSESRKRHEQIARYVVFMNQLKIARK
jgi:hypothetical protein